MRTLLLHNPKAGDGTPDAAVLQVALSRSGCAPHYCSKEDDSYKETLGEAWDLVAIAGGDGTVAKAARHLGDRDTPIAILPTGTANNVARSLGLKGSPEDVAANLSGAPTRSLDTGFASGDFGKRGFIEAVGLGAIAEAIAKSGPKPPYEHRIAHGRRSLCEVIAEAKPRGFALTVDEEKIEGEFLCVEILNLSFSGPRLPFAHLARPGDKLLDVVLLAEEQRAAVIDWISAHPEANPPPFGLRRGREVTLTWKNAPLRVDDRPYEATGEIATLEARLEDKSLQVLCPDIALSPKSS